MEQNVDRTATMIEGIQFCFPQNKIPPKANLNMNTIGELFPLQLLTLLRLAHDKFSPRRKELLQMRQERQKLFDQGQLPRYYIDTLKEYGHKGLPESLQETWKVAPIPQDLQRRRVEITGPVNSAKMVISMLNRNEDGARADTAMLDFEDSMCPTFENVINGYFNVIGAVEGNLTFDQKDKVYRLNPNDMALPMIRCRGLHLAENHLQVEGIPMAAGLVDLFTCFFHTAMKYNQRALTPHAYIPKCEHADEAKWWNDVLNYLETGINLPLGTIKTTFLIETLPAAYQIEEIIYETRTRTVGLNVGRWDKIFSDIKVLKNHPERVLPDRTAITMKKPWMDAYAKRLIKICHERGALALGGMAAFTPGKTVELRKIQAQKVLEDKQYEAGLGHDGCWVSHHYFISYAQEAFKQANPNQLQNKVSSDYDRYPDLLPKGSGPYTLKGLRTNIRVAIFYMEGWQRGDGCVALDNLMEDLATFEISRAQVFQWLHQKVELEESKISSHLVEKVFAEELEQLVTEFGNERRKTLTAAKEIAQRIFLLPDLADFLSVALVSL